MVEQRIARRRDQEACSCSVCRVLFWSAVQYSEGGRYAVDSVVAERATFPGTGVALPEAFSHNVLRSGMQAEFATAIMCWTTVLQIYFYSTMVYVAVSQYINIP